MVSFQQFYNTLPLLCQSSSKVPQSSSKFLAGNRRPFWVPQRCIKILYFKRYCFRYNGFRRVWILGPFYSKEELIFRVILKTACCTPISWKFLKSSSEFLTGAFQNFENPVEAFRKSLLWPKSNPCSEILVFWDICDILKSWDIRCVRYWCEILGCSEILLWDIGPPWDIESVRYWVCEILILWDISRSLRYCVLLLYLMQKTAKNKAVYWRGDSNRSISPDG